MRAAPAQDKDESPVGEPLGARGKLCNGHAGTGAGGGAGSGTPGPARRPKAGGPPGNPVVVLMTGSTPDGAAG